MKIPQLYIETSVWNFYFAADAPEKKEITVTFFDRIQQGEYDIFISDTVIKEINEANEPKKQLLLNLITKYEPKRLTINEEVYNLAQKYISEGIFPENKFDDAIHAAVATVFEMDALISWNLKHLANFQKMERINGINLRVLKNGFEDETIILATM